MVACPRNQRYLRPRSERTGAFCFAQGKDARQRAHELDRQRAVLGDEIASADIEREMSLNHVRHDAPKLLDRRPSVDEVLSLVRAAA